MRKLFVVFAALFCTVSGFSQKTADIGIWGGGATYFGDLESIELGQSIKPRFGAYFRYNFNPRVGLRAMFLTGNIEVQGLIQNTEWVFSKPVQDFSVQVEINYLKYFLGEKKTPFTSYLLGGIGFMYYNYQLDPAAISAINSSHNKGNLISDEPVMATTIPFGMGFKMNIGKRLGIGAEILFRKIFDDSLDNLDDPLAHINLSGEEITYTDPFHNNDYTSYLGLHLTYKIYIGDKVCPAYDSKE